MWNDWVKALTPHYRVIRFDRPPMGLAGEHPAGLYGARQESELIQNLTDKLQIERFILVATSSGGECATAYAAQHPEKIQGLILSNIAVGSFKIDTSSLSPIFKLVLWVDPIFKGWHPRIFWREVFKANFADPGKIAPGLVTEWTDLNNRAQRMPRRATTAPAAFAHTPADLAQIHAPTLLLWSADDRELPANPVAQTALKLLATADKELVTVAHCGHMMALECGTTSVAMAMPFLARVTQGAGVAEHSQ